MTALLSLRELIDAGAIALPRSGDKITENEVLTTLGRAASMLTGSYMWLAAGYELTWPSNDEMPNEITVPFYFTPEDIDMDPEEE
jgi:hypothetical protein